MRYEMDIDYSVEEMEKNKKRMDAYRDRRWVDRVPVGLCIVPRYFAKAMNITYRDVFKDADTQYELLLEFLKFQMENIRSDMHTSTTIHIHPYFDNVSAASHFGGQVEWPENETLQAVPVIKTIDEMKAFQIPGPEAGLFGTIISWWRRMKELAADTKVSFNGIPGKVEIPHVNLMPLGPHMIAVDLIGTDFYWWCLEYPKECHAFLGKITDGLVEAEEYVRKIDPRTNAYDNYSIAEDSSTIMSDAMFHEFVIPYDKKLYNRFGKKVRSMHMCGPSLHLHGSLVNELEITDFDVFGYQVPPEKVAVTMGGRVRLFGNINPMLMLNGTADEVRSEALATLEHLGPLNGYCMGDGANICPDTPHENIRAMTEACEIYAVKHPELFPGQG